MTDGLEYFQLVMLFVWPAFLLPILAGPVILGAYRNDPLNKLAGALTMKPLVATPLWALMIVLLDGLGMFPSNMMMAATVLPGILLTGLIVFWQKQMLTDERTLACILLAGDASRWLTTIVTMLSGDALGGPFYLAALLLPNIYALLALGIMIARSWRNRGLSKPVLPEEAKNLGP